jgi:hypothetical protein
VKKKFKMGRINHREKGAVRKKTFMVCFLKEMALILQARGFFLRNLKTYF